MNFAIFKNGASGVSLLQPLANVIIQELENMPVDDMLCYA